MRHKIGYFSKYLNFNFRYSCVYGCVWGGQIMDVPNKKWLYYIIHGAVDRILLKYNKQLYIFENPRTASLCWAGWAPHEGLGYINWHITILTFLQTYMYIYKKTPKKFLIRCLHISRTITEFTDYRPTLSEIIDAWLNGHFLQRWRILVLIPV